jgi:DNA replication and repair protein RecF
VSEAAVRLERISCRDFRNFEKLELDFPPEGIAIIGDNGQGKTNLLECIYYFQVLRSARGARDQDLVRFGAKGFFIAATSESGGAREMSVGFQSHGKRKKVVRDGDAAAKLSEAFGSLPSVMFSPRDIRLVAGSPGERRRYLDLVLALSSRKYLNALQTYRGALARRNASLRDAARTGDESAVSVWEPALAQAGAVIVCERERWVAERAGEFARIASAIGEAGESSMAYDSSLARSGDARSAIADALERQRRHDVRRGMTHTGPHRDDVSLTLDEKDLRVFGSAGQQRTAAIALRMLEGMTIRESHASSPLLLLDDPFAELDSRRSARILELLSSAGLGQTILVVPRATDIPAGLTSLERRHIAGGVVSAAGT